MKTVKEIIHEILKEKDDLLLEVAGAMCTNPSHKAREEVDARLFNEIKAWMAERGYDALVYRNTWECGCCLESGLMACLDVYDFDFRDCVATKKVKDCDHKCNTCRGEAFEEVEKSER